jgi:hypothetical protein
MVFYHKGLRVCKIPLPFVAYARKTAILREQIWSAYESDVVGIKFRNCYREAYKDTGGNTPFRVCSASRLLMRRIVLTLEGFNWEREQTHMEMESARAKSDHKRFVHAYLWLSLGSVRWAHEKRRRQATVRPAHAPWNVYAECSKVVWLGLDSMIKFFVLDGWSS